MNVPRPGSPVLVFLHSPKERFWGVLQGIEPAGVWIEGIDLASFEDWARQVAREQGPAMSLSMVFYPLLRVDKILLDRSGPAQPALSDRFRELVGMEVEETLGLPGTETRA